jgi:hypothetical protein
VRGLDSLFLPVRRLSGGHEVALPAIEDWKSSAIQPRCLRTWLSGGAGIMTTSQNSLRPSFASLPYASRHSSSAFGRAPSRRAQGRP